MPRSKDGKGNGTKGEPRGAVALVTHGSGINFESAEEMDDDGNTTNVEVIRGPARFGQLLGILHTNCRDWVSAMEEAAKNGGAVDVTDYVDRIILTTLEMQQFRLENSMAERAGQHFEVSREAIDKALGRHPRYPDKERLQ